MADRFTWLATSLLAGALFAALPLQAAEAPTAEDREASTTTPATATPAPAPERRPPPAPADDARAGSAERPARDDVFRPSEEISEDLAVSYPVDI